MMIDTMEYSNSTLGVIDLDTAQANKSYPPYDSVAFLEALNDHKAALLAPAMTFTLLLMVVGVVGNPLCIYIYAVQWQKTTTRNFLLTLAVIDLVNCLITMPTEIALMRKFFYFDNTAICRLSRFTTYWMNNASSVVLLVIAIDRYVRICRPHAQPITHRCSVVACCVSLVLGAGVSWPALVIYGQKHVPIPLHHGNTTFLVQGVVCSVSDKMEKEKYPLAFFMYLWIAFSLIALTIGVLYTLIGQEILKRKRLREDRNKKTAEVLRRMRCNRSEAVKDVPTSTCPLDGEHKSEPRELEKGQSTQDSEKRPTHKTVTYPLAEQEKDRAHRELNGETDLVRGLPNRGGSEGKGGNSCEKKSCVPLRNRLTKPTHHDDSFYDDDEETALSRNNSAKDKKVRNGRSGEGGTSPQLIRHKFPNFSSLKLNKGIRLRAGRSTLMLFAITVVYVLSFLPFLIVGIIRERVGEAFYPSLSPAEEVVVNIFIRSYLLNNCCNPIIYGLCNEQFRTELKRLYARIICRPLPQPV